MHSPLHALLPYLLSPPHQNYKINTLFNRMSQERIMKIPDNQATLMEVKENLIILVGDADIFGNLSRCMNDTSNIA